MFDHFWFNPGLVIDSGDPLELPPLIMATHPHDASVMPLKQLLTLLIDHCFTFEQLRDMTLLQLVECVNKANSGELLSFTEKERIERTNKRKK